MAAVEVWLAELTGAPQRELLSPDELERAARLARPEPWIAARAALRTVLARRLNLPARTITFAAGPHGKPELPDRRLRFNLTHSGERALIALADGVEVGIDVERTDRRSRAIERTLTEGERAALLPHDRHRALLQVWCRKEALAKAIGGGLGWAPETFDTTRPGAYALADLELGDEYVGALAVAAPTAEVVLCTL
jgi:4'-phosphopantetheinyl transferase